MFSPGIEPGTFCVLDRCDNRYTTKTCYCTLLFNKLHTAIMDFREFKVTLCGFGKIDLLVDFLTSVMSLSNKDASNS